MSGIAKVYGRYRNFIEKILFPAVLILYPLAGIRQGLDVSDATYSLANFEYFTAMDGMWMVATYLSNVAGSLLMRLPLGQSLMGMYFYTALVQSALAALAYGALCKKIPAPFVFIGEWIALGLCWCPSTVLYNYLTYLFMTAGALLLYGGVLKDDLRYFLAAGVCLGMNVTVRMPNVVQTAFILVLWYGNMVCGRSLVRTVRDTLWCVLGYAVGFGVPFAAICLWYGAGAYPAMVRTMFAMTEKATDYKPSSMVAGMFWDYRRGLYWMACAATCMAGACVLLAVQRKWFAKSRPAAVLCKVIYGGTLLVLLRFYWGRGMFSFRYYKYESIYYPAVLLLLTAIFGAVYCLVAKRVGAEQKILAALALVQIFVTPLGSNNYLYPIINNLFIVAPFILWVAWDRIGSGGQAAFVWKMPFVMLILFVIVQSAGFHLMFSFQDGIDGEARDRTVSSPAKAAGVYTTRDNGAWLEELAEYIEDAGLTGREALLYGEIPGLGYLLDMPSALSTFWADLDSYRMAEFERDMGRIEEPPVIIVASPIAAYLGEDADGMNWFGVDREALDADEKLQRIAAYMEAHSYQEVFGNGRYVVYVVNFT